MTYINVSRFLIFFNISNSSYLSNAYYVSDSVLDTLKILIHLVFKTILHEGDNKIFYSQISCEETEMRRALEVSSPRSLLLVK